MTFGNFKEKGYLGHLRFLFPILENNNLPSLGGEITNVKQISFPTRFLLTSNKFYVKIEGIILGFGISLEIHTRSDL